MFLLEGKKPHENIHFCCFENYAWCFVWENLEIAPSLGYRKTLLYSVQYALIAEAKPNKYSF